MIYTVLLCLDVADPATSLASNSDLERCFPLRIAALFTDGNISVCIYYLINIVNKSSEFEFLLQNYSLYIVLL